MAKSDQDLRDRVTRLEERLATWLQIVTGNINDEKEWRKFLRNTIVMSIASLCVTIIVFFLRLR